MNERIRELAVKAGATLEKGYIELSDGQFMLSDNVDLDKSNMDLEKFAELIVRECVDIIQRESEKAIRNNTYMGDDVPASVTQWKIKEHFGV